ncbi:hypothetical protein [Methylomicrobium lacus]|uniref:hypothetical protein n=1 Tax=Methylomicrobium lacus TaxID=136992 RepID=UPI00126972BD|nr:hypothetical protein [Methylomicrobium lacus]
MPALPSRLVAEFESKVAQNELVSSHDIHLSRLSGMAPADIDVLCDFTREEGLLLIIRCPKRPARYFQGRYAPKPMSVKDKSDPSTGLVTLANGTILVSDYDLMCFYRFYGLDGYHKVIFSGANPAHPDILPAEATALLAKVNPRLKSPFQHGAQDDYESKKHPNVRMTQEGTSSPPDRFIAFNLGFARVFGNPAMLQKYYVKYGLDWPYDEAGRHRSTRNS